MGIILAIEPGMDCVSRGNRIDVDEYKVSVEALVRSTVFQNVLQSGNGRISNQRKRLSCGARFQPLD